MQTPARTVFSLSKNPRLLFFSPILLIGCLLWLSGCPFKFYSRRDRFVKKVVGSSFPIAKLQLKALLGKPTNDPSPKGSVRIQKSKEVVLRVAFPKYKGYCNSITVYVPNKANEEGRYRIWIGPKIEGPWQVVGYGTGTKTFDIDGTSFSKTQFIRVQDQTLAGKTVLLDTVLIRVHTKEWYPFHRRSSKLPRKKAQAKAEEHFVKAKNLFHEQKYKRSIEELNQAILHNGRKAKYYYLLAGVHNAKGSYYQGLRTYELAQQLRKPAAGDLEDIGESYIKLGLPKRAEGFLFQCIRSYPLYPGCYKHLIHSISLNKERKKKLRRRMFVFYRDQYLIIQKRTHIAKRSMGMDDFFRVLFRQSPVIKQVPHIFGYERHLEWYTFLSRIFPQDKGKIFFSSLKLLRSRREKQKGKEPKLRGLMYEALLYHKHRRIGDAIKLFKWLTKKVKDPTMGAHIYVNLGKLYISNNQAEEAKFTFRRGFERFGASKEASQLLLPHLPNLAAEATTRVPERRKAPPRRRAPEKRTPPRKAPIRRAPPRKAPPARAPAKRTPAKKAPTKRAPAKKTPVKKTPAKKTPVKKAPAKARK